MTNEEALDLLEHGDWFQVVYNNLPESTASKVADAINTVAETFRSVPTGEPLTLQQLRGMVGQPAYLYIYATALSSGWHIIKAVTEDKIIFRGLDTVYVPVSTLGKCFDLYAYPPAHILREAWEPCEWCGEWIGGDCRPREQDAGYKLYAGYCKQVAADDFYEDETEELNYCPICGRPLTEEAWAELEKRLRGMMT